MAEKRLFVCVDGEVPTAYYLWIVGWECCMNPIQSCSETQQGGLWRRRLTKDRMTLEVGDVIAMERESRMRSGGDFVA